MAKQESQREITEELLRRLTDVDPRELERLRIRTERKPDKITLEQEVRLHEGVMQLAGVRLKGAMEVELRKPGSEEMVRIVAGSHRGGIERIVHLSPEHQEIGTPDGVVSIRPTYVPHFRKIDDVDREMLMQDNSVSSFDQKGRLIGTRIHPRQPSPIEVARLIPLLRDGEVTGRTAESAVADTADEA
ncbi:MAG: hypothetical protein Q8Q11_00595 [bacterium]|nr:hypothetical protein [bacterium]MDZ4248189.1 hypothetical protein [Patescibacteria group bacterium]